MSFYWTLPCITFEQVSHVRLLHKLGHYRVRGDNYSSAIENHKSSLIEPSQEQQRYYPAFHKGQYSVRCCFSLHQRPSRCHHIIKAICWWQCSLQGDREGPWQTASPGRHYSTRKVGLNMTNELQPHKVYCHQNRSSLPKNLRPRTLSVATLLKLLTPVNTLESPSPKTSAGRITGNYITSKASRTQESEWMLTTCQWSFLQGNGSTLT